MYGAVSFDDYLFDYVVFIEKEQVGTFEQEYIPRTITVTELHIDLSIKIDKIRIPALVPITGETLEKILESGLQDEIEDHVESQIEKSKQEYCYEKSISRKFD